MPYDNKQFSHSHRLGVCSFIHLEAADSAPANFIINNIYEIHNAHLIEGEKKGEETLVSYLFIFILCFGYALLCLKHFQLPAPKAGPSAYQKCVNQHKSEDDGKGERKSDTIMIYCFRLSEQRTSAQARGLYDVLTARK